MKISLGFFVGVAIVAMPLLCKAQSNSLGDRAPEISKEQNRKVERPRISRKQKLLFRKPKVQHTANYEYYKHLEKAARQKQRWTLKEKKIDRHSAEYEFYVRAEKVAREKQVMIKEMAKPQYSNFAYFGHKHPPKKHLPYAMRYCKECGIRH